MSFMKWIGSWLTVSSMLFTLTSCGSGGYDGPGNSPPPAPPATVTGQAVKGPFKKGSAVTAVQLGTTRSVSTSVTDDTGRYSLSIPWEGPTEILVTGLYTDDFDGQTTIDPITLAAVSNLKGGTTGQMNMNLATTMVAKLVEANLTQPADPNLVLSQDALVAQNISAFLGATSKLSDLASVDLSQPGPGPAQLLAFQLIVNAAIPPGTNVNQVISQFVENIRLNRTFTDPVPGINGVTAADVEAARTQLKGGTLTLKRTGNQVSLSQIIATLTSSAGIKSILVDLTTQINGSQINSIVISPDTVLVAPNQTKSLTAAAKNINGIPITNKPFLWFSSDPTIATVDLNGKVKGLSQGSVTVHASNGTVVSNSISVTVVSGALASIEVAQSVPPLQVGEQLQFGAKARDGAGNELTGVEFTWQSSDPTVATIDDTGLATALKIGTTGIVASNGAISSPSTTLSVIPAPPDPPTIDLVNPPGGLPGALITIAGSNFGQTVAENTVKFGTVTATIKSASAQKLVVIVPAGATASPITVTAPGGTVGSPFTFGIAVTNPGKTPTSSAVSVGSGPQGVTITNDETRVYVVNQSSTNVTVINGANNSVVGTVTLPSVSAIFGSAAATPDGQKVYFSLSSSIGVIDATLSVPPVVSIPCCTLPAQIRMSLDGKRLYVADGAAKLVVINTATNDVIKTYDLPGGQGGFGVAEHPEGKRIYVTNPNTDTLFAVDTDQNVVTPIPITIQGTQTRPRGIAIRPDGSTAYVSLFGANSVAVIDTATNAVTAIVPLPAHQAGTPSSKNPNGIAVSPDGKLAYVALTCGTVSASCPSLLDTGAISVLDLTVFPPTVTDLSILNSNATQDVAFTASGSHAYVTTERPGNSDRAFRLP